MNNAGHILEIPFSGLKAEMLPYKTTNITELITTDKRRFTEIPESSAHHIKEDQEAFRELLSTMGYVEVKSKDGHYHSMDKVDSSGVVAINFNTRDKPPINYATMPYEYFLITALANPARFKSNKNKEPKRWIKPEDILTTEVRTCYL